MRTTISLRDDVAVAVERLRRERGIGLSAAVNELIRAGLGRKKEVRPFRLKTWPMSARIDVTNVAEAIEELEGPAARLMLLDANLLLYASDERSHLHERARDRLTAG